MIDIRRHSSIWTSAPDIPRRALPVLSFVVLAPLGLVASCARLGLPLPEGLGAIEVQTAFRPQTPGSFDPLQIDWQGRWISATTSGSAGLTAAGDGHTLPAQQQAELHTFPLRDYLRPGIWQICLMAVGDGTPVVQHHCTVEIVGDQINRVQFTEGGIGCACTLPCQAPDPDAEVLEPCPE